MDAPAGAPNYAGHKELLGLPEGTTTVKARAISGAGVPSPAVGFDRRARGSDSARRSASAGTRIANQWTGTRLSLRLTATDPGELSGMASGPDDGDVHVRRVHRVRRRWIRQGAQPRARSVTSVPTDCSGTRPRRHSTFAVADDGSHTVAYRAFDVAGNPTAEKTVTFKIDQTPPELAVFEAQQRSDPRLVTVAASDRTSGLADGGTIRATPDRTDARATGSRCVRARRGALLRAHRQCDPARGRLRVPGDGPGSSG